MFVSSRIAANAVTLAACIGAGVASAQQPMSQSASAPAPAASSAAIPMTYRSAFEGYKGLTEQPVQPWRESNALVGRIGGWQSYAREGQGGPAAVSQPPGEAKGMSDMPGMSGMSGMSGMQGHHGGMKMPPPGASAAPPMAPAVNAPGPAKAPANTPLRQTKVPAGSASMAMPADHTGHTKP